MSSFFVDSCVLCIMITGKSDRSVRKEQELLEEEIGEMEGIVESEFEDVWHLGAGPKAKIEQVCLRPHERLVFTCF